jgi:hypothetical protein
MNNESLLTLLTAIGLVTVVTYAAVTVAKALLLNIVAVLP